MPAFTWIDGSASLPLPEQATVAIGNFDGVHRGHRTILDVASADAQRRGLAVHVLTFDPHPLAVLGASSSTSAAPPPRLATLERRAELLLRAGAERVFVRRFDEAFAAWSPERFASELVAGLLRARSVVVGANFRFGAQRAGDLDTFAAFGERFGFTVAPHALVSDPEGPLSSSRVRKAVAAGDLADAERVLGRRHALSGRVVAGAQRGRTIGFPTANVDEVPELLPRDGVYAVLVDVLGEHGEASALGAGVMNVGFRPTVAEGPPRRTVEVHLLDFARDLYGATLRVHLVAPVRGERKFESLSALKEQIGADAASARALTARSAPLPSGAYG